MTGSNHDSSRPAGSGGETVSQRMDEIRELERRVIELRRALLTGPGVADPGLEAGGEATFVLARCAGHLMAVSISYIEEVVQMPALRSVPGGARSVAGLVDYHGEILAVIDLGELAGGERSPVTRDRSLLICGVSTRRVGLMVEEITDVVTVGAESISVGEEVLPGALRAAGVLGAGEETAYIADVAWIALGADLAEIVADDAAIPVGEEER
ncbi:MAG: chemotaxis protein CheW [Polyangia bacterium]